MEQKARGPYNVKPTAKQLAYLQGRIEGKSPERAAKEAGYIWARPSRVVAELRRSAFCRVMHEAAEEAGITLEIIMLKLAETMDAKEKKPFVTRDGDVVYAEEAPVHDIQLKATQAAMDVLGLTSKARQASAEAVKPASGGVNILVLAQRFEHLSDEELEEAMQLMRAGQYEGSRLAAKVAQDAPQE